MKFTIKLLANFWNESPIINIYLNKEQILQINNFESKKETLISFEKDINDHKNELTIQREGKTLEDTVVTNGNIEKDSIVHVQEITMDKINIKPLLTKALFYPVYPEPWFTEQKQMNKTPPKSYSYTTSLHHNGNWKLQFEVPIHIWFFQNLNVSI